MAASDPMLGIAPLTWVLDATQIPYVGNSQLIPILLGKRPGQDTDTHMHLTEGVWNVTMSLMRPAVYGGLPPKAYFSLWMSQFKSTAIYGGQPLKSYSAWNNNSEPVTTVTVPNLVAPPGGAKLTAYYNPKTADDQGKLLHVVITATPKPLATTEWMQTFEITT